MKGSDRQKLWLEPQSSPVSKLFIGRICRSYKQRARAERRLFPDTCVLSFGLQTTEKVTNKVSNKSFAHKVFHFPTSFHIQTMNQQTTIIFACIHNAGRSQMAAALFNKYKTSENVNGISAGTEPADKVHPNVVKVMQEMDVDLTQAKPQKLTEELAKGANMIITMGCNEKCPYVPGVKIIDWKIPDPKNLNVEETIKIRDYIKEQIQEFIKENNF